MVSDALLVYRGPWRAFWWMKALFAKPEWFRLVSCGFDWCGMVSQFLLMGVLLSCACFHVTGACLGQVDQGLCPQTMLSNRKGVS